MKKQLIKSALLLLLMAFMAHGVNAQEKRITYSRVGNETKIVEFKDEQGTVVKTLDVEANNPYGKGFVSPKVDNLREGESVADFFTEGLVSKIANDKVSVAFRYNAYSPESQLLLELSEATIYVYDELGKITNEYVIDKYAVNRPLLANNGNYLGVYYGGLVHSDELVSVGIRIYDLRTNEIVHDIQVPEVAGGGLR